MESVLSPEVHHARDEAIKAHRSFEERHRGTGRTTRQIEAAPRGAIFVWVHHGSISYARDLARKLGRDDLEIVSPVWFDKPRFMGRNVSGIVVDHAANFTDLQYALLREALALVRAA